jgi:tetratricopeptide (TPR) repeat protein
MQEHLYHAAIEEFEEAIRRRPNALDPWVGLAAVHVRMGNAAKAVEGAAKAVKIAENSVDVQLILGRAHWLARNLNDAEQAALKVEALDPSNLHAAELLAHIYFDRNDQSKLQEVLDRTRNPNLAMQNLAVQFEVRRGEFLRAYELRNLFDRRNLESEILRAQLALKREPNRFDLYPALIRNLNRMARSGEAIAAGRQYRGPVDLDLEMGKAHWLAGNANEAVQAYSRAAAGSAHKLSAEIALAAITNDRRHWVEAFRAEWIEKDYFVLAQLNDLLKTAAPLQKALIYRYAALYDSELFNKAASEALEALKSDSENFEALMTLGTAYSRLGQIEDAARYVQQGADRHPERAEVWARLGQLALQKGDSSTAESHFARAVRLEPANPSYLYNYGWLLDQLERDADAVPYYERAIQVSSLSFEAMNNLALIEAANGRRDRALALLDRAVRSNPDNETAYLNRGNYYASLRSWQSALADYGRAREINPGNAVAFVESARVHIELGRADIAIDELSAALDVEPGVADGYDLLSMAYTKQGRDKEAAAALDEAKRLKESR